MLFELLVEKDYNVTVNDESQADRAAARVLTLTPAYKLTFIPLVPAYKGDAETITYIAHDARLAEADLMTDIEDAAYCEDAADSDQASKKEMLEQTATDIMIKALTYRALYLSNTQNVTTHQDDETVASWTFAVAIANAMSFAKENVPHEKFVTLNKVMTTKLVNAN